MFLLERRNRKGLFCVCLCVCSLSLSNGKSFSFLHLSFLLQSHQPSSATTPSRPRSRRRSTHSAPTRPRPARGPGRSPRPAAQQVREEGARARKERASFRRWKGRKENKEGRGEGVGEEERKKMTDLCFVFILSPFPPFVFRVRACERVDVLPTFLGALFLLSSPKRAQHLTHTHNS